MAQSHIVNRYPHSEGNILLASYDPLFLGVEPCVGFGDMQWQQVSSRRIGSNNRLRGGQVGRYRRAGLCLLAWRSWCVFQMPPSPGSGES